MMDFSKETRKKNTMDVINKAEKFMYENIYPNNDVNGFIVLVTHWIVVGFTAVYLVTQKVDVIFHICIIVWLIIFALHFYFHGCIFTKIEKHLWKAKNWTGPWLLPLKILEYYNVEITPMLMNNMFVCWGIMLSVFIILKIIYYT